MRKILAVLLFAGAFAMLWQNCAAPKNYSAKLDSEGRLALPSFEQFRTDYQAADEGTVSNPLVIDPCALAPVTDWQVGLCNSIATVPRSYVASNPYNLNMGYSRYWVLSVNDENAFQATNAGPPNQSLRVNDGLVRVVPLADGVQLGLSNQAIGGASTPGGVPFISYGLEAARGYDTAVLPNSRYWVSFDVTLDSITASATLANSIHFFVETMNQGRRVFSWIFLGEKHTGFSGRFMWNWPIRESMWYPGAAIDMEVAGNFANRCGVVYTQIPLTTASMGQRIHYDIDLANLVGCLSGLSSDSPITGIHFALEENTPSLNNMYVSFRNLAVTPK